MAVIIAKQTEIEAYFEAEDVNQSSLKNLMSGLSGYLASLAKRKKDKIENKPTPDYFLIGGAVDTILTGEVGEFEKQYYVSTLEKKPSEAEVMIVNQVFDELVREDIEIDMELDGYLEMLAIAIIDQNWYKGKPGEKRTQGLLDRCTPYFEDLKGALGKEIITDQQRQTIDYIVNSLRTNDRTKKYFDRETQGRMEHMDFYYQLPIYFSHLGLDCKALMDLVVVHKTPGIKGEITKIEPIDLKTMSGDTMQFAGSIRQRRYDIQAAWYVLALKKHFRCEADIIAPFKFVVESTTSVGKPLVFQITPDTLRHGEVGSPEAVFVSEKEDRKLYYSQVKGYTQLLDDYDFYTKNGWEEDRALYGAPFVLDIDWTKGLML